jgi:hypothetical protein
MNGYDIQEYGRVAVGMRVSVPGHRRRDPASEGELVRLYVLHRPRSKGIFAVVRLDDGRKVTTAVGLVSPVR